MRLQKAHSGQSRYEELSVLFFRNQKIVRIPGEKLTKVRGLDPLKGVEPSSYNWNIVAEKWNYFIIVQSNVHSESKHSQLRDVKA